ncbi:DUF4118 domain-containing protein [Cellulomonas soli]|uniref:DUF4118 domain-containing protein n=1 Tax=Cellulomonas soli TaxID=931535 RepID=UPI003F82AC26
MDAALSIRSHTSVVLGAAALGPLAVAAVLGEVHGTVTATTSALVLVLLVVAAASTGLRSAGIVAALSAAVGFDYFLTEPYNSLKIHHPDDVQAAVLLLVIGVAVSELAQWGLRQQARARRGAGYLNGVLGTAERATDGQTDVDTLTLLVARQVVDVLDVDDCRFEPQGHERHSWTTLQRDGSVRHGGREIDVARHGLPTDDLVALEVSHDGHHLGQLTMSSAVRVVRPSLQQRKIAVLLADLLGNALAVPGPTGPAVTSPTDRRR